MISGSRDDSMNRKWVGMLGGLAVALALVLLWMVLGWAANLDSGDRLTVSGTIADSQGKGIKEVEVEVLVNGHHPSPKVAIATAGKQGSFVVESTLPVGTLPGAIVQVAASKPSWKSLAASTVKVVEAGTDQNGNRLFTATVNLKMARAITPAFWIAALVLLLVYVIIAFEWMHRTLAAFLGAAVLLFVTYTLGTFHPGYFILSFEDAIRAIDMNVIFLLMGMMMFVGVLKKTGMFQWLAYKAFAAARGNVFFLSFALQAVTAVTSAFLDNVTTMLLMVPVTIEIAVTLKINPLVLLIPEVFASNVGGTATLIGDPPNILIGSYTSLTFVQFVRHLTVICVICFVVTGLYFLRWHRQAYAKAEVKDAARTIAFLKAEYRITDHKLTVMGLAALGFTVFLFVVHGVLHMAPSIAALTGSLVLVAISRVNIVELLEHEVEWPTLIFFIALFMVIAGAEETGLIQIIAEWVRDVSQGNLTVAVIMIIWVSAIASAFIDNIPFTATMLPIVAFLNQSMDVPNNVLWWSLALGACLGGNGTMIGASANVVTVGLAEKSGYHIGFVKYMRECWIPMTVTVFLGMLWLLLFEMPK